MKRILFLILEIMLLSACGRMGEQPPTAMPADYLPTAVALTAASLPSSTPVMPSQTASPAPTDTATPTPTFTALPTSTRTPTAGPVAKPGNIRILAPGAMSKVVSPIGFRAYIQPGANNQFMLELLGEDGRLLYREVRRHQIYLTDGVYTNIKIPFETRAAAELGRLQVSTFDAFGRPIAINSVHLLLMSIGAEEINFTNTEYARASFYSPSDGSEVYGGTLYLSGEYQPFNDRPIRLELISEAGKILGARILNVEAGIRAPFETSIPYDVDEATPARLILRQADEKFEGTVFLHSELLVLYP